MNEENSKFYEENVGKFSFICRKDTIDNIIFKEIFNRELYRKMKIGENDVVLDAGANIGLFVVKYASKCKKIVAYEPEPENFKMLKANLKRNNINNVVVLRKCIVGNEDQERILYVNTGKDTSSHTLTPVRGRAKINVSCENINNIIETYGINKIKMDVEGAEFEILMGITNENYGEIDNIALEFHFFSFKKKKLEIYWELVNRLKENFWKVEYKKNVNERSTMCMIYCRKV